MASRRCTKLVPISPVQFCDRGSSLPTPPGAPIVPGDHRLLDTERIKQADQMQQRVALYL
jgi:hypothetical protein